MSNIIKFLQGQLVKAKDSENVMEIVGWDNYKGKYLAIWMDENGFIAGKDYFDEATLHDVRGHEFYKYFFNFSQSEFEFLKRLFEDTTKDDWYIIVKTNELDIENSSHFRAILHKIDRRKETKFALKLGHNDKFQMLHRFYRFDEENSNIVYFDRHFVKYVLSYYITHDSSESPTTSN